MKQKIVLKMFFQNSDVKGFVYKFLLEKMSGASIVGAKCLLPNTCRGVFFLQRI